MESPNYYEEDIVYSPDIETDRFNILLNELIETIDKFYVSDIDHNRVNAIGGQLDEIGKQITLYKDGPRMDELSRLISNPKVFHELENIYSINDIDAEKLGIWAATIGNSNVVMNVIDYYYDYNNMVPENFESIIVALALHYGHDDITDGIIERISPDELPSLYIDAIPEIIKNQWYDVIPEAIRLSQDWSEEYYHAKYESMDYTTGKIIDYIIRYYFEDDKAFNILIHAISKDDADYLLSMYVSKYYIASQTQADSIDGFLKSDIEDFIADISEHANDIKRMNLLETYPNISSNIQDILRPSK